VVFVTEVENWKSFVIAQVGWLKLLLWLDLASKIVPGGVLSCVFA
jgi:hypothetical protein